MTMTPIEIRNRDFHKAVRGYRCDEVDGFIDNVNKEYEVIFSENFELKEKVKRLESQLSHYQQLENTLQQTMIFAQQTAEEVKKAALQEADLIAKAAELEKDRLITEAQQKWEEIQKDIQDLRQKREAIRIQLKSFLTAHLELSDFQEEHTELS